MRLSAPQLEVMRHAYTAVPEEMGAALMRSAYSPNIKERNDQSCAIFTPSGKLLAQAEHIPVHLGAMPQALEAVIRECTLGPGDQVVLNDPYRGGTHLPDVTLVKPTYLNGELLGYVVNRAHHADIGGRVPGSMPGYAETLSEEGIVIPPMKIIEDGEVVEDVLDLLRGARSPGERIGDLRAQLGANEFGAREFKATTERFGLEKYQVFTKQYLEYGERRTRHLIRGLPDGTYSAKDRMEWRDLDPLLQVEIEVRDDEMFFDFEGTSGQVRGNINSPLPVTLSSVYYVLRCLLPDDAPLNAGAYRPLHVHAPEGCLLNPRSPAAVSAGNVETSQRIVELILRALQPLSPDEIPAESMGTMNNLAIGNDNFTYYETIGGGAGASPRGEGESGVHVHMTNTRNTPVEALENTYPLRVVAYHLRRDSGGRGLYRGGDGIVKEILVLEDAHVSILSERRNTGPNGTAGGSDGKPGRNLLLREDETTTLPGKTTIRVRRGDRVRIETPGGGGWGQRDGEDKGD